MKKMHALALAIAGFAGLAAGAVAQSLAALAPPLSAKAVVASTPVPNANANQGHDLTKQDVDAWLDGFMPYAMKAGAIPGAVVVVVKDGQTLTMRGFGYADVAARKPVDPEQTLFRPGSVSKLLTWTAVMQQVQAGKLDLDADINNYLDSAA
jgi:CubicO group peptidase (beta-lactamase class C family)